MIRALLFLALFAPLPVAAHPHIFIDTGLEVIVDDQGRLTHIEVSWTYDAFYSLLISEEKGLDQDYDGQLTEAEQAKLAGFDMQWIDGFNGDLEAQLGGDALRLSGPMNYTARIEGGQIITTHIRAVEGMPVLAGKALVLLPYDKTFYTAYKVVGPVSVAGMQSCLISSVEPDIDAELEALQAQLALLDIASDPEDVGLPNAGRAFATEVRVLCAGS
jgi:ABC-type uncharacterized transport system substrate-binding protein